MTGKKLRLKRFNYPHSTHGLIVPLDHGLTLGPISGIESVRQIAEWIQHPAICGVIVHKGLAERLIEANLLDSVGLMIHLNGMSSISTAPDQKERLTTLENAIRLGADAVSLQVNFDGSNDAENLRLMGKVVDEAAKFSLPVLAMMYDKVVLDEEQAIPRLRHLMRIAIELGCDMIKIAPPVLPAQLPSLLNDISSDIPIFLAGGALREVESLYAFLRSGLRAGARGLCVGRNIFQRQDYSEVLSHLQELLGSNARKVFDLPLEGGLVYGTH